MAVAGSDNGVNASGQVWYGKSLQTASGFGLDYSSTYTNQSTAKHVHGSGKLFVASIGTVPSLTAAGVAPGAGGLLLAALGQPVQLADAPVANGTVFNVGSDTGGQVVFSGNQLTHTDQQGKVAAKHTFDGSDDVESNVKQVMNANVPPPSANQVKQACQGSATNVANTQVFSLAVDQSTTGSQSIVSVSVTKSVQVDCKTNQVTTATLVDVSGDIDGKGLKAISASPPAPDTAPPDSGPAPAEPPLTTFSIDSTDSTLVPLPLLPDGQVPTLDGAYVGSWIGSVSAPFASGPESVPISFSVSRNTITLTAPGSGSGSVDAGEELPLVLRFRPRTDNL